MSLGKNLKALRAAKGWDQKTLSQKSGVGVGTISAIEVRNSVRSQFAPALAVALGVSIDQLLSDCIDTASNGGDSALPQSSAHELADALEKVETALEKIKATAPSNTVHIEHAWPFKGINREQWDALSPEQKQIVESVASGFLIQHAAGASASHTEKRQAVG